MRVKVGDICTIWDPDSGPVDEKRGWVLGVVVAERHTKRNPQFQVHWSNDGSDATWYSEIDITFKGSPHDEFPDGLDI